MNNNKKNNNNYCLQPVFQSISENQGFVKLNNKECISKDQLDF